MFISLASVPFRLVFALDWMIKFLKQCFFKYTQTQFQTQKQRMLYCESLGQIGQLFVCYLDFS